MDGFIDLFTELIVAAGIPERCVFRKKAVELPGFFRQTKEWDLLVVREKTLLVAIKAKSQVGPSFGNNFNNRTEEAMGSGISAHQELTRQWWETRSADFDLVVSELVREESAGGDAEAARARLAAIDSTRVIIIDDTALALAERLVTRGPIPSESAADALHLRAMVADLRRKEQDHPGRLVSFDPKPARRMKTA